MSYLISLLYFFDNAKTLILDDANFCSNIYLSSISFSSFNIILQYSLYWLLFKNLNAGDKILNSIL